MRPAGRRADAAINASPAPVPLLLTWMAGPAGLSLHLAQRRRQVRG